MAQFPKPPFAPQQQSVPGKTTLMTPRPDHVREQLPGTDRLHNKKVLLTGGGSGIGRAALLPSPEKGADLLIAYLNEDDDARETQRLVEEAVRQGVLAPGDIADPKHCRKLVDRAVEAFGRIDVQGQAAPQVWNDVLGA